MLIIRARVAAPVMTDSSASLVSVQTVHLVTDVRVSAYYLL